MTISIYSYILENSCKKWGMKINASKCKVISPSEEDILIENHPIDKVNEFVFLGSVVPGTSSDIKRRIALASAAFGRLRNKIWNRKDIKKALKVRLYYALIVPIAIYASETWTLLEEDKRKLEVFENRCLRAMLGITLHDRIRNEKVKKSLNINISITDIIKKKRMCWFGHINRLPNTSYVLHTYKSGFPGPRPRGRPPKRWEDQIKKDTGLPLRTAEKVAMDRGEWRSCAYSSVAKLFGVCKSSKSSP